MSRPIVKALYSVSENIALSNTSTPIHATAASPALRQNTAMIRAVSRIGMTRGWDVHSTFVRQILVASRKAGHDFYSLGLGRDGLRPLPSSSNHQEGGKHATISAIQCVDAGRAEEASQRLHENPRRPRGRDVSPDRMNVSLTLQVRHGKRNVPKHGEVAIRKTCQREPPLVVGRPQELDFQRKGEQIVVVKYRWENIDISWFGINRWRAHGARLVMEL